MKKYLYSYDDPYALLAHYIVAFYRPADVIRILNDNSYIRNRILKETRDLDLGGPYIDCIIEGILEEKDRMDYMHQLDKLAYYYYSRLDKDRLREEILKVLSDAGICSED